MFGFLGEPIQHAYAGLVRGVVGGALDRGSLGRELLLSGIGKNQNPIVDLFCSEV